ncbi:MAG: hypothetical protein FWD11_11500 [Micrococcales bacterium]|nr:hypothetical protein [Micrococcales bacterium]
MGLTEVSIPVDPDQPIVIDGPSPVSAVVVNLPAEVTVEKARVGDDGTVVYHATDDGASAAVQVLDNGSARLQTITPDADGPHEFTYTFGEGTLPVVNTDGTVAVIQQVGNATLTLGSIDKAWAVDAKGKAVTTSYRVKDGALVQTISPSARTVYPVVADPMFTYGRAVYMNLTGKEWGALAAGMGATGVGATTAACLGTKLPAAWAKAVGVACTLIGVSTGITAFKSMLKDINDWKLTPSACYQVQLAGVGGFRGTLAKVDAKNCL